MKNIVKTLLNDRQFLYALLFVLVLITARFTFLAFMELRPKPSNVFCGVKADPIPARFEKGKELFMTNCASCHHKNGVDPLTGPPLRGTRIRWAKYPEADLFQFIRYPQRMIKAKHPRALELWKQWKPVVMNDFPTLSDEDLRALLDYIER